MHVPFILCESSSCVSHHSMDEFISKFEVAKDMLCPIVDQIINSKKKQDEYIITKAQYHNAICATKMLQNIDDQIHNKKLFNEKEESQVFGNVSYSTFGNVIINNLIARQLLEMYDIIIEILNNISHNSHTTMEPLSSLHSLLEEIHMSDSSFKDRGDNQLRNEITNLCGIQSLSNQFIDEIKDVYNKTFIEEKQVYTSIRKSKQSITAFNKSNTQLSNTDDINLLIKCGVDGSLTAQTKEGRHLHFILNGNVVGSKPKETNMDKIKICMDKKRLKFQEIGFIMNKAKESYRISASQHTLKNKTESSTTILAPPESRSRIRSRNNVATSNTSLRSVAKLNETADDDEDIVPYKVYSKPSNEDIEPVPLTKDKVNASQGGSKIKASISKQSTGGRLGSRTSFRQLSSTRDLSNNKRPSGSNILQPTTRKSSTIIDKIRQRSASLVSRVRGQSQQVGFSKNNINVSQMGSKITITFPSQQENNEDQSNNRRRSSAKIDKMNKRSSSHFFRNQSQQAELTNDDIHVSQVGSKIMITFPSPQEYSENNRRSSSIIDRIKQSSTTFRNKSRAGSLTKDNINVSQIGSKITVTFPAPDENNETASNRRSSTIIDKNKRRRSSQILKEESEPETLSKDKVSVSQVGSKITISFPTPLENNEEEMRATKSSNRLSSMFNSSKNKITSESDNLESCHCIPKRNPSFRQSAVLLHAQSTKSRMGRSVPDFESVTIPNYEAIILRGKNCSQYHLYSTEDDSIDNSKISVIFDLEDPAKSLVVHRSSTQRSPSAAPEEPKRLPDEKASVSQRRGSKKRITAFRPQVCASMKLDVAFLETKMRKRGIKHGNLAVTNELNRLGVNLILRACRPARVCRKAVLNERQRKCLPYSASIRSLPLSVNDIKIIKDSFDRSMYNEQNNTSIHDTLAFYTNLVKDDFYSATNYPREIPSYEVRYFFLPKTNINNRDSSSGSDASSRRSKSSNKQKKTQKEHENTPHKKYPNYVSEESLNKLIQKLTTESNITYSSLISLMHNDMKNKQHIIKKHDSLESLVNNIDSMERNRNNEFLVMKTQFENTMNDGANTCQAINDTDNFVSMPSGYKLVIIVKCTEKEDICEYLIRSKSKNIEFNCDQQSSQLQSCKLKLKGIPMCLDLNDVTQNQIGELLVGLKSQNPEDVIEIQIRHCEHCKEQLQSRPSGGKKKRNKGNNSEVYYFFDDGVASNPSNNSRYINSFYLERAENIQTATPFKTTDKNDIPQEKILDYNNKKNSNLENDYKFSEKLENLRFYMPLRNNELIIPNSINSNTIPVKNDLEIEQGDNFSSTAKCPIKLELSMLSRSSKPCTKSARSSKAFHSFSYYTNLVKDDYVANNNFPWVIPTYEINYFFVTMTFEKKPCNDNICYHKNKHKDDDNGFKIKSIKSFLSKYLICSSKKSDENESINSKPNKPGTSKNPDVYYLGKGKNETENYSARSKRKKGKLAAKKKLSLDSYTQTLLNKKEYVSVEVNSSLSNLFGGDKFKDSVTSDNLPSKTSNSSSGLNNEVISSTEGIRRAKRPLKHIKPKPKIIPLDKPPLNNSKNPITAKKAKYRTIVSGKRKELLLSTSTDQLVNVINLSKSFSNMSNETEDLVNIESLERTVRINTGNIGDNKNSTKNRNKNSTFHKIESSYVSVNEISSNTCVQANFIKQSVEVPVKHLYVYNGVDQSTATSMESLEIKCPNQESALTLSISNKKSNDSASVSYSSNKMETSAEDLTNLINVVNIFHNKSNSPFYKFNLHDVRAKLGKLKKKKTENAPSTPHNSPCIHKLAEQNANAADSGKQILLNEIALLHEHETFSCPDCQEYLEQNGMLQHDESVKRIFLPYSYAGIIDQLLEDLTVNGELPSEDLPKFLNRIAAHDATHKDELQVQFQETIINNSNEMVQETGSTKRVYISDSIQTKDFSGTYINDSIQTSSTKNDAHDSNTTPTTFGSYPVVNRDSISNKSSKGLQKDVPSVGVSLQTESMEQWQKLLHTDFSKNYVASFLKFGNQLRNQSSSKIANETNSGSCIQYLNESNGSNDIAKIRSLLEDTVNPSTFNDFKATTSINFDTPTKDDSSKIITDNKETYNRYKTSGSKNGSDNIEYDGSYRNFWVLPTSESKNNCTSQDGMCISEPLLDKKDSFEKFLDYCIKNEVSPYVKKSRNAENLRMSHSNGLITKPTKKSKCNHCSKYSKESSKPLDYKTIYDTLHTFIMEPERNDSLSPSKLVLNYFTNIIYKKVISDFTALARNGPKHGSLEHHTKSSNIVYYCSNGKIVNKKCEKYVHRFSSKDKYGISNTNKWIFNKDEHNEYLFSESDAVVSSFKGTNETSMHSSIYDTTVTKSNNPSEFLSLTHVECKNSMAPLNKIPTHYRLHCMKILDEVLSKISSTSTYTLQGKSVTRRCFSCNDIVSENDMNQLDNKHKYLLSNKIKIGKFETVLDNKSNVCKQNSSKYLCRLPNTDPFMIIMNDSTSSTSKPNSNVKKTPPHSDNGILPCKKNILKTLEDSTRSIKSNLNSKQGLSKNNKENSFKTHSKFHSDGSSKSGYSSKSNWFDKTSISDAVPSRDASPRNSSKPKLLETLKKKDNNIFQGLKTVYALTKINVASDGFKDLEVLDVSKISPHYYIKSNESKLLLFGSTDNEEKSN